MKNGRNIEAIEAWALLTAVLGAITAAVVLYLRFQLAGDTGIIMEAIFWVVIYKTLSRFFAFIGISRALSTSYKLTKTVRCVKRQTMQFLDSQQEAMALLLELKEQIEEVNKENTKQPEH